MKKNLFVLLIAISQFGFCQEFSFKLYFEDSKGNKDTLQIGYDINASEQINEEYGEVNIFEQQWNNDLEVRVTNAQITRTVYDTIFTPSIQCKKQIVKFNCENPQNYANQTIYIDVKCNDWPLTVKWDSTIFSYDCIKNTGIGFNDLADAGWNLSKFSELRQDFKPYDYYLTEEGDTIHSIFWVAFEEWTTNIHQKFSQEFSVFPNPSSDFINIELTKDFNPNVDYIEIFNSVGKLINSYKLRKQETKIDISEYNYGIYLIRVYNSQDYFSTKRFIKN